MQFSYNRSRKNATNQSYLWHSCTYLFMLFYYFTIKLEIYHPFFVVIATKRINFLRTKLYGMNPSKMKTSNSSLSSRSSCGLLTVHAAAGLR